MKALLVFAITSIVPLSASASEHCGFIACPKGPGPTGPIMPLPDDIYRPLPTDQLIPG